MFPETLSRTTSFRYPPIQIDEPDTLVRAVSKYGSGLSGIMLISLPADHAIDVFEKDGGPRKLLHHDAKKKERKGSCSRHDGWVDMS